MSEAIYRIGFERLGDAPFDSVMSMARIAPDLIRLQGYRSVYSLVSRFFRDERLRTIFSFHPLLIGGDPFSASSIYCLIAFLEKTFGVHSPIGGVGALVGGLVKLIEGQGGRFRFKADVKQILVENGAAVGVELSNGERLKADIVVSNADSAWTYRHLVPATERRRWTDAKLDRARYSMGLFVWYFGVDRRYDEIGHHTILMGPRYRGLAEGHFRAQEARRRFQPLSASPDRDRSRRSLRPAATRSTCCRRCPICKAGRTGGRRPSLIASASPHWLEANLLPGLSRNIS